MTNIRDPRALLGIPATIQNVIESLSDIYGTVNEEYVQVDGNYTTKAKVSHETIEATDTATITLSSDHADGQRVTVIRSGAGTVTIDTEGSETIVGGASYTLDTQYKSASLVKQANWFLESEPSGFDSADQTKLDGIEAGATADQSAAEIKSAYESNGDTNAFTDADTLKLDGIEPGAEVNPTNAEIKTAYEANSDTNAFTDAEKTKLTGVESGATADQSSSEIKTAYESNSNTNAFTDADVTKLDGIESGANVGVAEGTSSGSNSVAAGTGSTATASNTTSLGINAQATGTGGVAVGKGASGKIRSIAIGQDASTFSDSEVALGHTAETTANYAIAIGSASQATASSAIAIGYFAEANAANSFTVGRGAVTNQEWEFALPHTLSGTNASVPLPRTIIKRIEDSWSTTSAQDISAYELPIDTILSFMITVAGWDTVTDDACSFVIRGGIKNAGGTTALVGTPTIDGFEDVAGFDATVVANNTTDDLDLRLTSANSNLTYWTASVWGSYFQYRT